MVELRGAFWHACVCVWGGIQRYTVTVQQSTAKYHTSHECIIWVPSGGGTNQLRLQATYCTTYTQIHIIYICMYVINTYYTYTYTYIYAHMQHTNLNIRTHMHVYCIQHACKHTHTVHASMNITTCKYRTHLQCVQYAYPHTTPASLPLTAPTNTSGCVVKTVVVQSNPHAVHLQGYLTLQTIPDELDHTHVVIIIVQ